MTSLTDLKHFSMNCSPISLYQGDATISFLSPTFLVLTGSAFLMYLLSLKHHNAPFSVAGW